MRTARIARTTNETDILLNLNLDGTGKYAVKTGCGFLDHMLELFARHGRFDLEISAKGDTHVDYHHLTEDIGIALGLALTQALGDKRGIVRYGNFLLPMDESLVLVAVDLSGRAHLGYGISLADSRVGDFDTALAEEFMLGFVRNSGATLHFKQLAGGNTHHVLEAAFKGMGRALACAVAVDSKYAGEIPSTKGVL